MRFVLPTTYARTRIYRPRKEPVPLTEFSGADVFETHVHADDGVRLNGWHAVSRVATAQSRPLILYFPGASGHRGYRLPEIELFAQLGCDMLLFDYRGYGDNGGRPSEGPIVKDARLLWRFAREELDVPAERIVIFGESLGGAVGIRLAAELCRRGVAPGGLILRATFACMLDVVSQFFPRFLANIFLVDRYPSVRRIRRVSCPVLSIHGTNDRLIPIDMGRRVFAAAPQASTGGFPKRFLELPGVGHNDVLDERGEQVRSEIAAFLATAVPPVAISHDLPPSRSAVMQPLQ